MPGIASSYWKEFDNYLSQNSKILRCGKGGVNPKNEAWTNILLHGNRFIGKNGFELLAVTDEQLPYISVGIVVRPDVKKYFGLVHWGLQFDGTLETEFGSLLKWTLDLTDPANDARQGYIMVDSRGANPANENQWQTQYGWMCGTLHQLVGVFEQRLARL